MALRLHNTLTGNNDEFISQTPNLVKLYTCGPTVYNYLHIGNWFGYIAWDILVRVLMANDYTVERVMNITDVGHLTGENEGDANNGEDKLAKGARREGKTAWEVAQFYGLDFVNKIDQLGLIKPQHIAKATDYIPQQLELVRKLKNKGFTYQIDDGIYFDTSKFPRYADFAHLDLMALRAGARVEMNPQKHNASDFALWKFSPNDEKRDMEWETPDDLLEDSSKNTEDRKLIMGFPGWHLECSAMAMTLLGETLDIHTGGIDHIPVHHTNEIAQSEAVTDKPLSNFWLHNNHLKVNGTKISKSLGNGYTIDDLTARGYTPNDYRMFVLQTHYRSEGNFTFENLTAAQNRLRNWRNIAAMRHQTHDTLRDDDDKSTDKGTISLYATSQALLEVLNNDLDTPAALVIVDEAFSRLTHAPLADIHQHAFIELLDTIDQTLGLQLLTTTPDVSDDIKRLILKRQQARSSQDWKTSDKLRQEIEKSGVTIRDTAHGPVWEYLG